MRSDGRAVDSPLLHSMCEALEHRGPDSRGVYAAGSAGLGIQRLRIIDLETGDQPIFNEDRTVAVVLNGEIYNYRELRAKLQGRGHRFRTASDTEVIAHLYEENGPDCVSALHGMFGLAIWDARSERLTLARDRVGKKPLFYSVRDGVITFASELNAVMRDHSIPRDLDHAALDAYFAYRWVPAPQSAYRAVRKLPAASTLVFERGRVSIERYWRLEYEPKHVFTSQEEVYAELRDTVRRAVARRMIADVPLGAFLSGGVDSSVVVATMAEASSQPVRTFSIGFDSDDYNELPQARIVARRFGTEHHEFVVRPNATEIIPKVVRHYGEPFADASAIPSFYLAQMAREHVTVALNGDGGDETFAGYSRYQANMALQRLDRVPRPLRAAMSRVASGRAGNGRIDSFASRLRRVATAASLEPHERYAAYHSFLDGLDRDGLYTPEYRALLVDSAPDAVIAEPWMNSTAQELVDRMLDVDVRTYLTDDLLVKMDIATMAHSLEARSPLLDHEYMEFAASLPPFLKVTSRAKKIGLREAFRGCVPDEILDARKRGFRLPFHDWFRGELREYAYDLLLDGTARARGMFRESYVRELLDQHVDGARDNSQGIWSLLAFELWQRELGSGYPIRPAPQAAAERVPVS